MEMFENPNRNTNAPRDSHNNRQWYGKLLNGNPLLNRNYFSDETKQRIKRFTVDTATMIIFSFGAGMANEMLIAGMTLTQSLSARLTSVIPNIATGGIYGEYRNWVLRKFKIDRESNWSKKTLADAVAFGTFQAPLYAMILSIAGADLDQIQKAVSSLTLTSAVLGRPYGVCLDWLRRASGAKEYYER